MALFSKCRHNYWCTAFSEKGKFINSIPVQTLAPTLYFFFVLLIRSCHTVQRFTGVHLIVFTLGIPLSMETTSHQSYTAWSYGTIWCWGWGKAEPTAQQWIPPAKGQWRVALIVSLLVAWTGCLTKHLLPVISDGVNKVPIITYQMSLVILYRYQR